MSKGELRIISKSHKYYGDAHTTLILQIIVVKYASCRTDVFYKSHFQVFGNTKLSKYTCYSTVNFHQGFLPALKVILLTSYLGQEICILSSGDTVELPSISNSTADNVSSTCVNFIIN